METNNQHDHYVEILSEVTGTDDSSLLANKNYNSITPNQALTAMQKAVGEAENALIAKYQNMEDELTTLRTEAESYKEKVADQLGFERTASLMKQSKEEITCGTEGGGDGNKSTITPIINIECKCGKYFNPYQDGGVCWDCNTEKNTTEGGGDDR